MVEASITLADTQNYVVAVLSCSSLYQAITCLGTARCRFGSAISPAYNPPRQSTNRDARLVPAFDGS
jgi:hypothetical protein